MKGPTFTNKHNLNCKGQRLRFPDGAHQHFAGQEESCGSADSELRQIFAKQVFTRR